MIRLMTNKDFEEKYPNWVIPSDNMEYINLPRETFIVLEEDGSFTAIDNTSNDCWVETFDTVDDAVKYCLNAY